MEGFIENSAEGAREEIALVMGLSDYEFSDYMSKVAVEALNIVLPYASKDLVSRMFSILDSDQLLRIFGRANTSSLSNLMKYFTEGRFGKFIDRADNDLVERMIDSAPSDRIRVAVVKCLPAERRRRWLDYARSQKKSVENIRAVAESAKGSLLDERTRLLGDLDEAIKAREDVLRSFEDESRLKQAHYDRMVDEARQRLASLQDSILAQEEALKERENILALKVAEFEEANKRQVQQRIELKVPEFVTAALGVLELRENLYRKKALHWAIHGAVVLIVAIVSAIAISLFGYLYGGPISDLGWQALVFVSFKGLVVMGVLGLWAKHAFNVSSAYMHEAIKRSDRAHAINFGKLYLEIYGNSVDRKELISVFENWNIASESAFSKVVAPGFEPKILDKISEIIKGSKDSKGA